MAAVPRLSRLAWSRSSSNELTCRGSSRGLNVFRSMLESTVFAMRGPRLVDMSGLVVEAYSWP
jgi:hypothetical protein